MVHLEDRSLIDIISDWQLPKPVSVVRLDGGFTGDVWRVEANGQLYIAKLAYESRDSFEIGLLASEIVERHGLRSGAPLRTPGGDVTVMVEHPPGKQHPLALLRFVPGDPLELIAPAGLHTYGKTLGRIHHILIDANYKPERSDSLFPYLI